LLSLVFAESALELIPREVWGHPSVVSDARRRGLGAGEILLDRSFHHSAMLKLRDSEKRGRPDLVHTALLSVTGTPMYLDGRVRVYVHTYPNLVVEVAPKTRIPKNFLRFRGVIEKCLAEKPAAELLRVGEMRFPALLDRIVPGKTFGLSVRGTQVELSAFAEGVVRTKDPCVVVGGFPHGHFSRDVAERLDALVRIDERPLEAHVVVARTIYEIEKATKRFND
jgi:rRNA small subunit pseudouridine methyltransferase Nep1